MSAPVELPVPAGLAETAVRIWRHGLSLPDRVTDEMIYARLRETSGMSDERARAAVLRLVKETRT